MINIIKLTDNTAHTKTGVGLNLEKPIRTSIRPSVVHTLFYSTMKVCISSIFVWEGHSIVSVKG